MSLSWTEVVRTRFGGGLPTWGDKSEEGDRLRFNGRRGSAKKPFIGGCGETTLSSSMLEV